jgi:tetratricopeptide (TPR) repeat protein
VYPEALASVTTALQIDPALPEALFNRALVLEKLGLIAEARRAWQRYLDVDASSAWAAEARAHLAALPGAASSLPFERDRAAFEVAAVRGDEVAVRAFAQAYRGRVGAYGEAEYLGRWGEAWTQGQAGESDRWLTIARAIGSALPAITGESLLRDAVRAIDEGTAGRVAALAEAHVIYRRGRIAYSRQAVVEGERDLRDAARRFAPTGSPMVLLARYYAASARLARNDVEGARAELEAIRGDSDRHPEFIALGAHVRWELARAYLHQDVAAAAAPLFADGAARFARVGDAASEAFMQAGRAAALASLGRVEEAWTARTSAFAALSAAGGDSHLLASSLAAAATDELRAARHAPARALASVASAVADADGSPVVVAETRVHQALLEAVAGDPGVAIALAGRAEDAMHRIPDAAVRDRALAMAAVAAGASRIETDPAAAAASLSRAIDFYRARGLDYVLPEALLLRARSARKAGDLAAARRDFDEGIALVERHPLREAGVVLGVGVLDAERALFAEAAAMSLAAGDAERAFAIVERAHGSSATMPAVQQRLRGSGTVLLEIVALPPDIVTFAIAEGHSAVGRRPCSIAEWNDLAQRSFATGDASAAAALYDLVIRPVEHVLASAHQIVIVPDTRLADAPFASLYDTSTRRYLIERLPVAMASSAGALRSDSTPGAHRSSLAALALPAGPEAGTAALPDLAGELTGIAAVYGQAQAVPPAPATLADLRRAQAAADVVHLAGHTTRRPGADEQALVFASAAAGGVERASWPAILASPIGRTQVVVLAACETLRSPASPQGRAMSLGAAFVRAGAADAIGTLTPIPDRDARSLFIAVHRGLAAGDSAARALQRAQIDAIHQERGAGAAPAWRAVAVITGRIPRPSPKM